MTGKQFLAIKRLFDSDGFVKNSADEYIEDGDDDDNDIKTVDDFIEKVEAANEEEGIEDSDSFTVIQPDGEEN